MSLYPVNRHTVPHLRCGLCDEPIHGYERTVYLDDERCHVRCVRGEVMVQPMVAQCPRCGRELDDESLATLMCIACGEEVA